VKERMHIQLNGIEDRPGYFVWVIGKNPGDPEYLKLVMDYNRLYAMMVYADLFGKGNIEEAINLKIELVGTSFRWTFRKMKEIMEGQHQAKPNAVIYKNFQMGKNVTLGFPLEQHLRLVAYIRKVIESYDLSRSKK
jgi:hypothetical protein